MRIAVTGSDHDFVIDAVPTPNTSEADTQSEKLACTLFLSETDNEPLDTFDAYYNPNLGPLAAAEAIITTYASKIAHTYPARIHLIFSGTPVLKRIASRVIATTPDQGKRVAFQEGEGFVSLDIDGTEERIGNSIQLPKPFLERDVVEMFSMLFTQIFAMLRKRMLEADVTPDEAPEILTP